MLQQIGRMPDNTTYKDLWNSMPTLSFFLATTDQAVDDSHPLWNQPLPNQRHPKIVGSATSDAKILTYGGYFSAVARFCEFDGWRRLKTATSRKLETTITEKDLKNVSVFLEKHGAFYHPARIQVRTKGRTLSFVLNVAASQKGQKVLPQEVKALERLHTERPFGWFPEVFGATLDAPPMFLGDWFEGYHEFHRTRLKKGEPTRISVWDGSSRPRLLTVDQEADMISSASMILTACYDPLTAHQIFPWHHAAGDFVIRLDGKKIFTRLITVRNYGPLTESQTEPADEMEIMEALMVFFLHLSIRMRLDRINGVSDVVWAPAPCPASIIDGFLKGLDLCARISGIPDAFPDLFRSYFNRHTESDLLTLANGITKTVYDQRSEEHEVIVTHLPFHIKEMNRIFSA